MSRALISLTVECPFVRCKQDNRLARGSVETDDIYVIRNLIYLE